MDENLSSRSDGSTPNTGDAPQHGAKAGPALESAPEKAQGAPPSPPTQGDVELWEPIRQVLLGRKEDTTAYYEFCAALRQRADEATRAERERCARMSDRAASNARYLGYEDAAIEFENLSAAISARITPKGEL